jgi:hypothetical protein
MADKGQEADKEVTTGLVDKTIIALVTIRTKIWHGLKKLVGK